MRDPPTEKPLRIGTPAKDDVAGPFALVDRPVVVHRQPAQQPWMRRMDGSADLVQRPGPRSAYLLIQQSLGLGEIFDGGELVVPTFVAQARLVQLPRQPFATVHADLHGEGEPGLEPSMHQPKDRMHVVVVQERALALLALQLQQLLSRLRCTSNVQHGSTHLITQIKPSRTWS